MSPAGRPRSGQGPTGPSSASGHAATQDPRASRLPARPGSAGVPGLHPPPPPPLPPRLRPSSSKFALGLKFLPSFAHRSARVPRPSPRGLGGGFEGGGAGSRRPPSFPSPARPRHQSAPSTRSAGAQSGCESRAPSLLPASGSPLRCRLVSPSGSGSWELGIEEETAGEGGT